LATDWFPEKKPVTVVELLPADGLDEILPQIDVLILAAPLNHLTHGIINAERLARFDRPFKAWYVTGTQAEGDLIQEDKEFGMAQGGADGSAAAGDRSGWGRAVYRRQIHRLAGLLIR